MGLKLTGDRAHFSGFNISPDAVFFFREGEEVCYWDLRCEDEDCALQIAKCMKLFYEEGVDAAVNYCEGRHKFDYSKELQL